MSPRVGQKIPNMPEEYLAGREKLIPGLACLMGTDQCPRGVAVFIRDSVVVHVGKISDIDPFHPLADMPEFDAIIMNFADIPEGAAEAAAAMGEEMRKTSLH